MTEDDFVVWCRRESHLEDRRKVAPVARKTRSYPKEKRSGKYTHDFKDIQYSFFRWSTGKIASGWDLVAYQDIRTFPHVVASSRKLSIRRSNAQRKRTGAKTRLCHSSDLSLFHYFASVVWFFPNHDINMRRNHHWKAWLRRESTLDISYNQFSINHKQWWPRSVVRRKLMSKLRQLIFNWAN